MALKLILAESPRARYVTGAMMYFAQGIPAGLLSIAIPAWLATQGVSASAIASYLAVIVLPWAFKLITGPLMDRFEFLSMGRRRPWVIAAQLGLCLSLLSLMLIDNPAEQIGLLMIVGVLINSFAATQDVAVDGMAIDLTPVNEQGKLNAYMSFGKAIGWSVTAAVSGTMLVTVGMKATAITASLVAGIVLLMFIAILERKGERKLPWSPGKAASGAQPGNSFKAVFSGINQVLWKRASVVVLAIMLFDGLVYGYGQALMPIAAVKLFGYTTPQWSQLVAMMGLIGAGVALLVGPMIDRFGAKRMLILTVSLLAVHAFLISQTQYMWENTIYVRFMLSLWIMMLPVSMVSVIALAMAVCKSRNSATQFAIYMSVANLGHSAGSWLYGIFSDRATYVESYFLLGILVVGMIIVLLFHRHRHEQAPDGGKKKVSRYTVGAGGGAGIYWSGAMRCPKCRADMEQVSYEGTEVDRCSYCNGIWFDDGELELLSNKQAATAIDTGAHKRSKNLNQLDEHDCPRCGGEMHKKVDPKQTHIWYESCRECNGSFFDAGELLDLSEHTFSDYFKRLVTPRRD